MFVSRLNLYDENSVFESQLKLICYFKVFISKPFNTEKYERNGNFQNHIHLDWFIEV